MSALVCHYDGEDVASLYPGGRLVELVSLDVSIGQTREVHRCRVLEMADDELVLSWPEPPLADDPLGATLEVTVLCAGPDGHRRWGYATIVLDVLSEDWRNLGPEPVLVVLPPTPRDLELTSLRSAPRYPVPPGGMLWLELAGIGPVEMVDISLAGLRMRLPQGATPPEENQTLAMRLGIWDAGFQVGGRVVAVRADPGGAACSVALDTLSLDVRVELVGALNLISGRATPRKF